MTIKYCHIKLSYLILADSRQVAKLLPSFDGNSRFFCQVKDLIGNMPKPTRDKIELTAHLVHLQKQVNFRFRI
jgi:hypothetical protein